MINEIKENWNKPCKEGHLEINEHAPCQVVDKLTPLHQDAFKRMQDYFWEELTETRDANKKHDMIEVIDGLCDMRFVLDGLCAQFGVTQDLFDSCYLEIYNSNMTKKVDGKFIYKEGKVKKPKDTFVRPYLESVIVQEGFTIPPLKDDE